MRSSLLRWFPRSLWLQTITLLFLAIALSTAFTGWFYWTRFNQQAADELEKRGHATVATLEKHSDLRLAISLADASQAAAVGTTSLAVFTVMILIYFRWVARRLQRMGEFAELIAAGELKRQLDDPVEDDLGRLASALRSMAERTAVVVKQLVEAVNVLS